MYDHLRLDQKPADALRRVSAIQVERAMSVGTGSAGGFAIPIDLDPAIMSTGSGVVIPIRQIADVRISVGDVWKVLRLTLPLLCIGGRNRRPTGRVSRPSPRALSAR